MSFAAFHDNVIDTKSEHNPIELIDASLSIEWLMATRSIKEIVTQSDFAKTPERMIHSKFVVTCHRNGVHWFS